MLYNIKYNATKQYGEVEPNRCAWSYIISFTVVELGYTDTVSLPVEGFTKLKAKAAVKAKIKDFLTKKAEEEEAGQEEYTEEIL